MRLSIESDMQMRDITTICEDYQPANATAVPIVTADQDVHRYLETLDSTLKGNHSFAGVLTRWASRGTM